MSSFLFINNVSAVTYTATVTDKDGINVRSGAGTDYSISGSLNYNAKITLVSNAKKHRSALNDYTVGIARAILLLGRLLFSANTDENDEIQLTNKDGFLIDDETLQQQYLQDYNNGLMSKLTYLQKARNMNEQQALEEIARIQNDNPSIKSLIGE